MSMKKSVPGLYTNIITKKQRSLSSRLNAKNTSAGHNYIDPDQSAGLVSYYAAKLNTLRMAAIASIVWGHALLGWEDRVFTSLPGSFTQLVFIQFGRIGTIIFFVISGFFFAEKLKTLTVPAYIKYRFKSVILPWLLFVFLCVALQFFRVYPAAQILRTPFKLLVSTAGTLLSATIFHAAYWFIPVSIISACLLIIAKKIINKIWFGPALACITLFYQVNLYFGWVPVIHTKAILGYVFFMWLGVQLKNNITRIHSFIKTVRWPLMATVIFLTFLLTCAEGLYLKKAGCLDAFASIRFSNTILSLLIFAVFIKFRTIYRVKKMKPQKYVYGVYLLHSLILLQLVPVTGKIISHYHLFNYLSVMVLLQVGMFCTVLTISYLFAMVLKNSRLHFFVGR